MPNYSGVWKLQEALDAIAVGNWPTIVNPLNRAILTQANSNIIEYVDMATKGNTSDFGDLTVVKIGLTGLFSTTRAVFSSGSTTVNVIDYVTIATTGNAVDFGDQTNPTNNGTAGVSSGTRGVIAGGNSSSGRFNVMQYITIASGGNTVDFGDLLNTVDNLNQGGSNGTRGIIGCGGYDGGGSQNIIQYITIASTGNATDFGDTALKTFIMGCASNNTRMLISKAGPDNNSIQYITIATTGNATDFGDLYDGNVGDGFAFADQTICTFGRSGTNVLSYVTIASTGNSVDFGDRDISVSSAGQIACGCASQGGLV